MGTIFKGGNSSITPRGQSPSNKKAQPDQLIFVVQKHHARQLHYDFRLELNGELISWALPKGPTVDPKKKHLAIQVENHPLSYKDFEGTIQEGQYGAGEVIVWDKGIYEWTDAAGVQDTIRKMKKGLKEGKINIKLTGTKLNGEFHLIRMKEDEWLFMKSADKFSSVKDVTKADRSVLSNKKTEDYSLTKSTNKSKATLAADRPSKIIVSHPDKIYWPKLKITKQVLFDYYSDISEFILPFLQNRLHSLHRHPDGIHGVNFYQKNIDPVTLPAGLKTHTIKRAKDNKDVHYLLCDNVQALLYMVNQGCIEINPWNSTVDSLSKPDWLVIDLDPEGVSFKEVVKAALEVRRFFDEAGIKSCIKTSGFTGMHIYVPVAKKYTYTEVRAFAKKIASIVQKRNPETTSIIRSPAKRQNMVYLDYLQNSQGQTVAAPFSVRPGESATVSMPLEWTEINLRLSPEKFTLLNGIKRIEKSFELWKPVLEKGVDLKKCLSGYG
jgi:DNA ligase D